MKIRGCVAIRVLPDATIKDVIRTFRELKNMDAAVLFDCAEIDKDSALCIDVDFPKEKLSAVSAYIDTSPIIEMRMPIWYINFE